MRLGLPLLLLLTPAADCCNCRWMTISAVCSHCPPSFPGEEEHSARLTGQDNQLTGFLVTGESAEQALQRLEDSPAS